MGAYAKAGLGMGLAQGFQTMGMALLDAQDRAEQRAFREYQIQQEAEDRRLAREDNDRNFRRQVELLALERGDLSLTAPPATTRGRAFQPPPIFEGEGLGMARQPSSPGIFGDVRPGNLGHGDALASRKSVFFNRLPGEDLARPMEATNWQEHSLSTPSGGQMRVWRNPDYVSPAERRQRDEALAGVRAELETEASRWRAGGGQADVVVGEGGIPRVNFISGPPEKTNQGTWGKLDDNRLFNSATGEVRGVTGQGVGGGAGTVVGPGGKKLDPKDVDKVQGALSFRQTLDSYRQTVNDFNDAPLFTRMRARIPGVSTPEQDAMVGTLQTSKNQLMYAIKNMEGLGALQEGEIKMLNRMIGDVLSTEAIMRGPEYVNAQVQGLYDYLDNKMNTWAQLKGYDPSAVGGTPPGAQPGGWRFGMRLPGTGGLPDINDEAFWGSIR